MSTIIRNSKGQFMKGCKFDYKYHTPWNKGLKGFMVGVPKNTGHHWKLSEETKHRISKANTKHPLVPLICQYCQKQFSIKPYRIKSRKGYIRKYCSQNCYSKSMLGKKLSETVRLKLIQSSLGRVCSDSTKEKISRANRGANNGNWIGGFKRGNSAYGHLFTDIIKTNIKQRDNNTCQLCNQKQSNLDIHHINYNKLDNSDHNLITLCHSCHAKTNIKHRVEWESFFLGLIFEKYKTLDYQEKEAITYDRYTQMYTNQIPNQ